MTWGLLLLIATTLLTCTVDPDTPDEGVCCDFGIFNHAKSRAGSHISDTAVGKYAPIDAATVVPTFCDVRLIIPIRVPLCFRCEAGTDCEPWLIDLPSSDSLPPGLRLLSRVVGDEDRAEVSSAPFGRCGEPPSLKTWTVSVADETHRRVEVVLKAML